MSDSSSPLAAPGAHPVICLTCLYPLESCAIEGPAGLLMGLRHPEGVEDAHPCDPGYAIACAFCGEGGEMWFVTYGRMPLGAGRASGAINVCVVCRDALEDNDVDLVLERAMGLMAPSASPAERVNERERIATQLEWLAPRRRGPARLARDLVPNGGAILGKPAAQ